MKNVIFWRFRGYFEPIWVGYLIWKGGQFSKSKTWGALGRSSLYFLNSCSAT